MTTTLRWLHRQLAGIVAIALVAGLFVTAQLPTVSAAEQTSLASGYSFTPMTIALPAATKNQTIRKVNQAYRKIDAWISSVGAAIAMNDLTGTGHPQDLCLVDPRSDQVIVTPVPGTGNRYAPFALNPAPLPMNDYIAPMGCVPGDFNGDGRMDLLVYYWGRTPILFMAKPAAKVFDANAYNPVELLPGNNSKDGKYVGPQWNTDAATIADFDGDGHADIFIGNYFPDGPVLNPNANGGVTMNQSMSHAKNAGGKYIFRWTGSTTGAHPSATFAMDSTAIPAEAQGGWSLAASATDIDGDGLPELYIGNDFGPDVLLYNRSTPGHLAFSVVRGIRGPMDPKSKVLGNDSFKGMGVDFADLNHNGQYDMFVSNITTSWGIQESNFQWMNTAPNTAALRADLRQGIAPFKDVSASAGTAWSGWGWDVKIDDFNNSGQYAIAQATGFLKGQTNRWPQLQELAAANDALLSNPFWWPNVRSGDDLAGNQPLRFWVPTGNGHYTDLAPRLGLAVPVPTRGIATGDAMGNGLLDFAVARQWDAPVYYRNNSPSPGSYLSLKLTYDTPSAPGPLPATGSPVIGAEVKVTTPDGKTFLGRVDGGSGHSGFRSHEVHIGLGAGVTGPLKVHLQWRDLHGTLRQQDLTMNPGSHSFTLGAQAKEK